jgi:hypothetical protein
MPWNACGAGQSKVCRGARLADQQNHCANRTSIMPSLGTNQESNELVILVCNRRCGAAPSPIDEARRRSASMASISCRRQTRSITRA